MTTTNDKPLSKKAQREKARESAINRLREILPKGSTVYGVQTHRSSSGMSARIKVLATAESYTAGGPPRIADISALVSDVTGLKWHERGSVVVGGCGFSRIQHIAASVAQKLYGEATALKYESI